ncbi:MAG: PAS domain S-box protein [Opitutae bacterium]|nr:PAS domain S-box protein [Opitutae bacterium]
MKIATKIHLLTAGAVLLIVGDAAIDLVRWNSWEAEQASRSAFLNAERVSLRATGDQLTALAAALARPSVPGTREWNELGVTGERAITLLRHSLDEIQSDREMRTAPSGDPLAASVVVLQSATAEFERHWRSFRALVSEEDAARVAAHVLAPALGGDVVPSLQTVQRQLADFRTRGEQRLAAQIHRERNRQVAGSLVLVGAIGICLYAINRQFLRPLRRIEREARSVNRGERLHVGFTYTDDDELGALARAVNDTIDQLRSTAFSRGELERQVAARTAELRERERELQESRAQLRRALDGSQLGTWEWNAAADTVDFTSLCVDILGYAPGEIPQTAAGWDNLLHPDDLPRARAATRAHLKGDAQRYEIEVRFRAKSGEWRWVRSLGRIVERGPDGRALRLSGTHADIQTRKIAELNLQRREEQLRLALAASGSALWDADLRDRSVFLDERWAQFIGAPPGETRITLQALLLKVPEEERPRVLAALERIELGHSDEYVVEHRYRRDDGSIVWVRSRGRCVERDADGRALRIIGINVDLTAMKASEFAAGRQAELYSAVNETALDLLARRGTAAVLRGLVDRAATLLDAPSAEVALLENELLVPRAWCGTVPEEGLKPVGREAVLAWRAIETCQPAVAHNYRTLDGAVAAYSEAGVRAAAVFPILHEDRAIGVLGVCRFQPDQPFTADDVEKGRLLAQLSALALRNATIYEDAVREADAKTTALRESEEKFRGLFDHGPVPVVLASFPEGIIADVNTAVTTAFGYTREECIGRHVLEAGLWSDEEKRERWLGVLAETGRLEEMEVGMRHRSGARLELLMHSRLVQIAGRGYSLNTFIDVTHLKRTERALREGEQRFHAVFEESPVMMFLLSFPDGKIVEVNSAAERGFGSPRAAVLGRTSLELAAWVDQAERDRYLKMLRDNGHVASYETRMRRLNGEVFSALFSGSLIEIGGQRYTLNSIQDITAQRVAEARLRQTQKMESLGTLAGGIAHDFNNLLTGILGSAELIRLELPGQHAAQRWLENIASGGARAKRLVQQILAFSRRSEGERGAVDLVRVVEEALRLLGSTLPPMVQIDAHLDRACPPIRGDATQLHQVMMNLCTNAWQALPADGGRIGVRLERREVTAAQQSENPELPAGLAVVLTVTDDGCGMTPDVAQRIFDPFFTTKEAGRGTGLGLAVVHGIVRDHGGAILVRSTPGAGTTFELYFRALGEQPAAADALPALAADIPRGQHQRILFVDDDPGPRAALADMLQFLGYQVTAVGNPAEALLKFAAQPTGFDLLVVDYAMPGMTGFELARQVRDMNATLPILIVSGHLEADRRAESSRLHIAAVLSKPPSMADLARAVAGALASPAAQ